MSPLAEEISATIYREMEAELTNGTIIYETEFGFRAEVPHELHDVIYLDNENLDDLLDEIYEELN
jgi:hypothetical protein